MYGLRMSRPTSVEADCVGDAAAQAANSNADSGLQARTGLQCLARIAAQHGVDLSVERLRHTYAVDGQPVPTTLLLRMAKEAGLRAQFHIREFAAPTIPDCVIIRKAMYSERGFQPGSVSPRRRSVTF